MTKVERTAKLDKAYETLIDAMKEVEDIISSQTDKEFGHLLSSLCDDLSDNCEEAKRY